MVPCVKRQSGNNSEHFIGLLKARLQAIKGLCLDQRWYQIAMEEPAHFGSCSAYPQDV